MIKLLQSALRDIWINKTRSLLTVLGILVGISSVTMMVSIGGSAQVYISDSIVNRLGKNLVIIMPGDSTSGGGFSFSASAILGTLDDSDYQAILQAHIPELDKISRRQVGDYKIRYYNTEDNPIVFGVDPDFFSVLTMNLVTGRYFRQSDVQSGTHNIILGQSLAKELFKLQDPVGRTVQLDGHDFEVIGVVEDLSGQMMGSTGTTEAFVPIDQYRTVFNRPAHPGAIYLTLKDTANIDKAKTELTQTLRQAHGLMPTEKSDFSVSTQSDIIDTSNSILGTVTLFISVISSISLVVGGIGVMNIMLVSVKERVKEIGLRKALGATNVQIQQQILTESVMFSLIGGILGIILGTTGALVIQTVGGLPIFVSVSAIASGLAVSSVIGIIFGLYPALQAGKLSPIEALRSN